ncbi:hypothetical protein G3G77_004191 [Salmonella enterica]|nr:hypothetical protein [Salmonella enterica]EEH5466068.1 hypothetical protein [Salmonella enterica]EEH7555512.1 hypothetical protein [Salmonella enterica]EEO5639876.1 hypothetical protein [Salmonella enterica]EEQ0203845.1 hypothetical protein [Salmonella enterica]
MFRENFIVILAVSAFSSTAMAADDPLQGKVQDYCGKISNIIVQAAGEYNHQRSNAVKPDEAKIIVTREVKDSDEYISASPAVKAEIDKAINSITDYTAHSRMVEEQMKNNERYVGMHGWSWAYHNVTPFTAWCNYNHIQR